MTQTQTIELGIGFSMNTSVARQTNAPNFATAYYFLEGLKEIGIDYLFCNFGTDHAPIIEEMANRRKRGEDMPSVVRCPHESTAAHMAAGYAFVTGRGQGVLVHVDVGTANTATAMHNIFRSRLPVLLMAGKAPYTANNELVGSRDTYVHFVQEPFDQASLVRPYLKWEWTLPSGVVVKEALRRAHAIMQSEPCGPVYLMMQRETLTQHWGADEVRRYAADQFSGTEGGTADPKLVDALVERLLKAEHPLMITGYAARHVRAARAIEELAQFAGMPVVESNMTNNVSHDSACFAGFSPNRFLSQADVGLLVDVDVPWFASEVQPNESTFWAHIDIDILKPASPMWTFPGNLRMQGDSGRILQQVLTALQAKATPAFRQAAAARLEMLKAAAAEREARSAKLAADKGKNDAINPHYLFAELSKLLDDNDIVFNEGVRNAGAALMQVKRPVPNTMMRAGGGGLGWSGGMALGAKLAAPDQVMVQVVGDGGFYFGNPSSTFAVAQQYKLPIFTLVLDNSGWSAVKESTLRVFPSGEAKAMNEFEAELAPDVDFSKVGQAFGAHAEKIADPAEVPAALARCLKAVRGGRTALLHARVTRL
jgi:acetolactate synthase-1/2/3 large subunit